MFKILIFTFLLIVFSPDDYGNIWSFPDPVQDPATLQLKKNIEQVVATHRGLCAGLAIIPKGHPDLIFTMGQDKSNSKPVVSENTMFRTGFVSKIFIALSILRLEEECMLSLEDPVREIIQGVRFENRWEKNHPVRIVHLLEHTTGWDEIHLAERMNDRSPPVTLMDALAFHPHSRKSRWVPGSMMAYCNVGYAVAARIVEKISGKTYEEFVEQEFFDPLGMRHSTFFNDRVYKHWAAETHNQALEKVNHRNELYRPAELNSSPADLAMLLKLLMNRGTLDSGQLINERLVERMKIPGSTPGAKAGLELGYGLGILQVCTRIMIILVMTAPWMEGWHNWPIFPKAASDT